MRARLLYIVSALGALFAVWSAYVLGERVPAQPPLFQPAPNPYAQGIYANGIVESLQAQGGNISLYPEVTGTIARVLVAEGQRVRQGEPLLAIDDSVQHATTEQLAAQADAAQGLLDELKAQPRRETLAVLQAQVASAQATLRTAQDTLAKQERSFAIDPRSLSRDALDTARNTEKAAAANLGVAQRQLDLTRAGAWAYDVRNQQRQVAATRQAYKAAAALLAKYVIRAPVDGVVLSVQASPGSYVSPQGTYDANTQGMKPVMVMTTVQDQLAVRAYVDEILVHRLPPPARIAAEMTMRGTELHIPLQFVRLQPYVVPKIQLSDQRQERVDVRVLPIVFAFRKPANVSIFPGQIVDVYIGDKHGPRRGT